MESDVCIRIYRQNACGWLTSLLPPVTIEAMKAEGNE